MMHRANDATVAAPGLAEPAWDVAKLFPSQGHWSEQEYFALHGPRLVEYSKGWIEVLSMPTTSHQTIVAILYTLLLGFVTPRNLGKSLFAPLRVRLWDGKFREPDVLFLLTEHSDRIHEQFWDGADLVIEVVSDDERRRDLETKRFEYARAGIPEYWIVDPQRRAIIVLKLDGQRYEVHGEFLAAQQATSVLLPGFAVDVSAVFAELPPNP